MSKFKVGDKARFINSGYGKTQPELKLMFDEEVLIVDKFGSYINCDGDKCYGIRFADSREAWVLEESLEPLQNRPELGTIEELKMITGGWTPGHVTKRKVNS